MEVHQRRRGAYNRRLTAGVAAALVASLTTSHTPVMD